MANNDEYRYYNRNSNGRMQKEKKTMVKKINKEAKVFNVDKYDDLAKCVEELKNA